MKKFAKKFACLLLTASMMVSLQGCSVLKEMLAEPTEREYAGEFKPEWSGDSTYGESDPTESETTEETEETEETEATKGTSKQPTKAPSGKYIKTSDELTYPDHVPSFDEVHPKHQPGRLKDSEAVARLNEVEKTILKTSVAC